MSEKASIIWSESELLRRLNLIILAAGIALACRAALEEGISSLGWALAGGITLLLTAIRWPYGALTVLIGASAMPVFFVEMFGWKARPEHLTGAIIAAAVAVWFILSKHRPVLNKLDYWIIAFVALNFISSAFASSAPSLTLRWALQNSLAVLPYFLVRLLVTDLAALGKAFRILLGVGVVEAAYGILCFVSNRISGSTTGMSIGQYFSGVSAP